MVNQFCACGLLLSLWNYWSWLQSFWCLGGVCHVWLLCSGWFVWYACVAWETFKVWGVIDSLDSFSGHVVGHFVELFGWNGLSSPWGNEGICSVKPVSDVFGGRHVVCWHLPMTQVGKLWFCVFHCTLLLRTISFHFLFFHPVFFVISWMNVSF